MFLSFCDAENQPYLIVHVHVDLALPIEFTAFLVETRQPCAISLGRFNTFFVHCTQPMTRDLVRRFRSSLSAITQGSMASSLPLV